MSRYADSLMDHFLNPRNVGDLADADAVGTVGDPACGDFMTVSIKVRDGRIEAIRFLCHGCPAAIATGSAMTVLADGRTLQDAATITDARIADALGGMPDEKVHCSNLGAGALQQALLRYNLERATPAAPRKGTAIERLRRHMRVLAGMTACAHEPVTIRARPLRPEEAIGRPAETDYPIVKGRERMVEGTFRGSRGHAFTDSFGDWEGTLGDVLEMDLADNFHRGVFVAILNAVTRHVGISRNTVHCRDEAPQICATEAEFQVLRRHPGAPVTLVGYQPRLGNLLSRLPGSRVVDLDPENVGKRFGEVEVEGPDRTDACLAAAGVVLVTGSTLVNGTIDRFLDLPQPTVFYGVTIAGAAALLGLRRFCPCGT